MSETIELPRVAISLLQLLDFPSEVEIEALTPEQKTTLTKEFPNSLTDDVYLVDGRYGVLITSASTWKNWNYYVGIDYADGGTSIIDIQDGSEFAAFLDGEMFEGLIDLLLGTDVNDENDEQD